MILNKKVVFLGDGDPNFITGTNAATSGLPINITLNQYGFVSTSGTSNVDNYKESGTTGDSNLAYSVEIPNNGVRQILSENAKNYMLSNFENVQKILDTYKTPIFSRNFLLNKFYIIKISDFGNQSLSFDGFDFFAKVYYGGAKIPQFRIGFIRRLASKEAYILVDKRFSNADISANKFSYIIEPITKDNIKNIENRYVSITNSSDNSSDRYISLVNYISFLEAQIVYANNSSESSYKYKLTDIIYSVLMDKRFELLYKNGSNKYQKINSHYYASLLAAKLENDNQNVSIISDGTDLDESNHAEGTLVSYQTHHNHNTAEKCNFDYYKYLYSYLFNNNFYSNIDEEMRRTSTIALLDIFNLTSSEITNLYIRDRSMLPEYYLYEITNSKTFTVNLKNIDAVDINDFEIYVYYLNTAGATSYISAGYRLPMSTTSSNRYRVNKDGNIVCTFNNDQYKHIEIIPKHTNLMHIVEYSDADITGIDAIRGILKNRKIYGYNFADSKFDSIETYSANDSGNMILSRSSNTGSIRIFDFDIYKNEILDDELQISDDNDAVLNSDKCEFIPEMSNNKLILYADPMFNLSKQKDKSDESEYSYTSEYTLYSDKVSDILTDAELKYIENTSGNKFTITNGTGTTQEITDDYDDLNTKMQDIRSALSSIIDIFKNIEGNMDIIRDNFEYIFSSSSTGESFSDAYIHKKKYTESDVPTCIKLTFDSKTIADNRIVNILECSEKDTNNIEYNFEQFKIKENIIYIPIYQSPITLKIFVTEYDTYKNSKIISSGFDLYDYDIAQ